MTNEESEQIRQKAREQHKHILLKLMPDLKPHEIEKLNNDAAEEIKEWAAFAESLLSGGAAVTLDRCIAIAKQVNEKHSTCSRLCLATSVAVAVWDEQDDAGAAPPAASPQPAEPSRDQIRAWLKSYSSTGPLKCFVCDCIHAGHCPREEGIVNSHIACLRYFARTVSGGGSPATQDHKFVSNAFDKTCAICGKVHS